MVGDVRPWARRIAAPATVYAVIATVGAIRSIRQSADRCGQRLDLGRDQDGNVAHNAGQHLLFALSDRMSKHPPERPAPQQERRRMVIEMSAVPS